MALLPPVLLTRTLDNCLGIFTGCFAYYLYENHPRNGIPPDERLGELIRWRWNKYQMSRIKPTE